MKTWAPWATDAPGEIGQEEWPGARWNPRIKEYQSKGVMSHFNDDGPSTMPPYEGGYNAWCACFVSWALDSTGYEPLSGYSAQRAKAYQNWGQDPGFPAFGAVSVVGSHVGFEVDPEIRASSEVMRL